MDFLTLAKQRYSVRKYEDRPIEEEKLAKILEAGHVAPTGVNHQPQRIHVIRSQEGLAKIRGLTKCHYEAPVVLLISYQESEVWKNPLEEGVNSGQQDVSIVATHMMLEAWEQGIGSCWVNLFSPSQVAREMDLPEGEVPVLLLLLGVAAEDAQPAPWHEKFRPLEEIVSYH